MQDLSNSSPTGAILSPTVRLMVTLVCAAFSLIGCSSDEPVVHDERSDAAILDASDSNRADAREPAAPRQDADGQKEPDQSIDRNDAARAWDAAIDVDAPAPEFGTEHFQDVPRLIMFPLKRDADYQYEQSWDDCRPSATNCTRAHRAVDIYAEPGTPIYAGADGTIAWRNTDITIGSGGGYQLHLDPDGAPELRLAYAHFGPDEPGQAATAFAENPRTGQVWDVGDTVSEGELLGYLGTSGATASGPHLHFAVRSRMDQKPQEEAANDDIAYGDADATPGTFGYLRFDPWFTLQLAEQRELYP